MIRLGNGWNLRIIRILQKTMHVMLAFHLLKV